MDFDLTSGQNQILARLKDILPTDRALPETSKRTLDRNLLRKMRAGSFFELARTGGRSGLLDMALVIEEVTRAVGIVPLTAHGLVAPLLFPNEGEEIIAIQDTANNGPFRFAGDATILVLFDGDVANAYRCDPGDQVAAKSNYVFPLAMAGAVHGDPLASAPASAVRRRHRIGISIECVGAMDALLKQLADYLSTREQFGRKIASFQAIHHRLAELSVLLEGSRWLAREAAWLDEDEAATLAATYATKAARRLCWEAHELAGARGFSVDFGLYQHTLRLQALSIEAGGIQEHADAAAELVWASN